MSCATCVRFRRSVVGGVGYCALDRRREPLNGSEQRPCWMAAGEGAGEGLFSSPAGTLGSSAAPPGLVEGGRPPISGR